VVNKIYRIVNTGVGSGVRMTNTMHLGGQVLVAQTVAELQAALVDIANFYTVNASYFGAPSQWTIGSRVLEYDLDDLTLPPVIMGTTAIGATAGSGGAPLPSACAICVSWRTLLAGPSYRGRTFMGPLSASVLGSGLLTSSVRSTVQLRANQLLTDLAANSTSQHLYVFSKLLGTVTAVTSAIVDDVVDNLSSRKF
jgi:hypothetical protein